MYELNVYRFQEWRRGIRWGQCVEKSSVMAVSTNVQLCFPCPPFSVKNVGDVRNETRWNLARLFVYLNNGFKGECIWSGVGRR